MSIDHYLSTVRMKYGMRRFCLSIFFCYIFYNYPLMAQICNNNLAGTAPDSRYQIHNDGTVTDLVTGLIWKRCIEGSDFNNGKCTFNLQNDLSFTWQKALKHASGHTFAGYDDWRLPNKNELVSLFEERCFEPAMNINAFPYDKYQTIIIQSSTTITDSKSSIWTISFIYPDVGYSSKSNGHGVRLVRSGQAFDAFDSQSKTNQFVTIENAVYDTINQLVNIQDVQVQNQHYQITLQGNSNYLFSLKTYQILDNQKHSQPAIYDASTVSLQLPRIQAFEKFFKVRLKNLGDFVFGVDKIEEIN